MKKILFLLSVLFIFSCTSKKTDDDILVIGTSPTFPPFEYYDDNRDAIVGFDIELAKEIAKDMNKKLKIVDIEFTKLREAVQTGKIDMTINGITITEERKKHLDFSIPYYEASLVVLARKDDDSTVNIKTKEELGQTKKIAAASITTSCYTAYEIAGKENVVEFPSWNEVIDELLNSLVDAVIIDRGVARAFTTKYDSLSILSHIELNSEYYGIAVKKGNRELLSSVNTTISRLINSGEYVKLVEEHINKYSSH